MEDIFNTSQNNRYDCGNSTTEDSVYAEFILKVLIYIIVCVGLPLTLVAIYALYSMVRNDHVAPIYVINLFITDLFQLCCMISQVAKPNYIIIVIFYFIYGYCLFASVGFMLCTSMERYLVIAWPLWYRFRRTIRSSVVVCVLVWISPIVCNLISALTATPFVVAVFFLLPFPLFIFSLVGTLKALSASISVPSDEKRRIVGMLVLVLLIYTLLFLPSIILILTGKIFKFITLITLSNIFVKLSPLADLFLYVFMKKGTIDKLLASVCCCRMDSSDMEMGQPAGCTLLLQTLLSVHLHCQDSQSNRCSINYPLRVGVSGGGWVDQPNPDVFSISNHLLFTEFSSMHFLS